MDQPLKKDEKITGSEVDKNAADRLQKFENLFKFITEQQQSLPDELDIMRRKGETKSYKYRETFGHKLMNDSFVMLLKRFDLL